MNRFRRGAPAPGPDERAAGSLLALGWLASATGDDAGLIVAALESGAAGGSRSPSDVPLAIGIAPVVLARLQDPLNALDAAAATLRDPLDADAARYGAAMLVGLLHGVALKTALAPLFEPSRGLWEQRPLAPAVTAAAGSLDAPSATGDPPRVRAIADARRLLRRRHDFPGDELPSWRQDNGAETGYLAALLAGAAFGENAVPPLDASAAAALGGLARLLRDQAVAESRSPETSS